MKERRKMGLEMYTGIEGGEKREERREKREEKRENVKKRTLE